MTSLNDLFEETARRGDFVPAVAAEKIVADLRKKDPERLKEYTSERLVLLVTQDLTRWCHSQRSMARTEAPRREFREASSAFAGSGDVDEFRGVFAATYRVDVDNTQRAVGEMTGDDHKFVASTYRESGERDLMFAAFHNAVARKVGKSKTADVLNEDQYLSLMKSIKKKTIAAA